MEVTIVIPAYNEESSISNTIQNIRKFLPDSLIMVVDDKSNDKTREIALKEKVMVVSHAKNKGYGAALKTGLLKAKTKYVGFLDADMTYPPKYFPAMLSDMKKYDLDCIWGNRFGGDKNKMPLVRKLGNRVIVLAFFIITGKDVKDCSSGMRILKKDAIKKLDVQTLPDELDFITALTKRIVSRKLKYKIIPIDYEQRRGASKLSLLRHGYKMIRNVLVEK